MIARRKVNNLRYADDTILMEENGEELQSLLMKLKEESEKAGWREEGSGRGTHVYLWRIHFDIWQN